MLLTSFETSQLLAESPTLFQAFSMDVSFHLRMRRWFQQLVVVKHVSFYFLWSETIFYHGNGHLCKEPLDHEKEDKARKHVLSCCVQQWALIRVARWGHVLSGLEFLQVAREVFISKVKRSGIKQPECWIILEFVGTLLFSVIHRSGRKSVQKEKEDRSNLSHRRRVLPLLSVLKKN